MSDPWKDYNSDPDTKWSSYANWIKLNYKKYSIAELQHDLLHWKDDTGVVAKTVKKCLEHKRDELIKIWTEE